MVQYSMRELFRYPNIQAARTAASYRLLSREALHQMGVAHIEKTLKEQAFDVVFRSSSFSQYPQLKAQRKDERLLWIIVESSMYPNTPELEQEVGLQLLGHAQSEDARVLYAPVMFINTKSQNLSLPSQNGRFTALFNGFVPITRKSLR